MAPVQPKVKSLAACEEAGDFALKEKDYLEAESQYTAALKQVGDDRVHKAKLLCYRSAARLPKEKMQGAYEDANEALDLFQLVGSENKLHVKALYRRALASEGMGHLKESFQDLVTARHLASGNEGVRTAEKRVVAAMLITMADQDLLQAMTPNQLRCRTALHRIDVQVAQERYDREAIGKLREQMGHPAHVEHPSASSNRTKALILEFLGQNPDLSETMEDVLQTSVKDNMTSISEKGSGADIVSALEYDKTFKLSSAAMRFCYDSLSSGQVKTENVRDSTGSAVAGLAKVSTVDAGTINALGSTDACLQMIFQP